jgi:hypothetical protein
MAAATTAAASTAATGKAAGRLRGSAVRRTVPRAENRKLNRVFLTRTLGASNFLLLVNYDFLKVRFAIVANVFVYGHKPYYNAAPPNINSLPSGFGMESVNCMSLENKQAPR